MKPSERIEEIQKQKRTHYPDNQYTEYDLNRAIMDYLDEEWEKKYLIIKQDNGCDHESDGLVYISMPPQMKCKWCGMFYR